MGAESSKVVKYRQAMKAGDKWVVDVRMADESWSGMEQDTACEYIVGFLRRVKENGNKIIFVGNGGSATIASHMAIDWMKNGGIPAMALNDAAALTCLANDLGYQNVFSTQLEFLGKPGDVLIAISSSGNSPNIVNAVNLARQKKEMLTIGMSGFDPKNQLRQAADLSIYVPIPKPRYGPVEIMHLQILHMLLDAHMGEWL